MDRLPPAASHASDSDDSVDEQGLDWNDPEFRRFVQVGIDAADRGELIPHEEVKAKLDEMIARHRARCD